MLVNEWVLRCYRAGTLCAVALVGLSSCSAAGLTAGGTLRDTKLG